MATIRDVVFDCRHPASLARFWAQALDGYDLAPYDDAELERLRGLGVDDPGDDPTVLVQAPDGRPRLWFQRVVENKIVKNRVHLDLAVVDVDLEVGRLVALGATVSKVYDEHVTMLDPEGNEFCLMR